MITAEEIVYVRSRVHNIGEHIKPGKWFIYVEPFLKRSLDISLSGIGLVLSAWLWVLISMMVIIEDGFPVIIRQRRIGKAGIIFGTFKFRSMIKTSLREKVNYQAKNNDVRVTVVGRILRKSALDELPQLLNILRGDMSFVGPRALLPNELENNDDSKTARIDAIPGYEKRIAVRPGLTGLAQIFAPRDIPRRHKFKYDLLYIRKMSFRYDLVLIMLSFLISLNCTWEKHTPKLLILKRNI
jgi:lipopolysaccharide/colanic/teichoic acid biosynthesis glycosyltransferase